LLGVELRGPTIESVTVWTALGAVVLAPLVETLALAALLHLLGLGFKPWPVVAAISAALWGVLHGVVAAGWFFGTVWSFFVFSAAYLAWRRNSFRDAFLAAALPHAFLNSIVMLILAVS
jgi:hypothetical protein